MRYLIAGLFLALAMSLHGAPTSAHHGWSSYQTKAVTVEGPILALHYANPHAHIEIEHEGERWTVVLAPVSRMKARGLTEEMLAAGKTVQIVAYPSKSGEKEMRAERISVDGKTVELR